MLHGCAGEVQVVHGADDATCGVQDDVQQDDLDGDLAAHHAEHHEQVGHHHGGEQLQEVLHPQVHHPEAPELRDGQVGLVGGQQAHRVEGGDGQGRVGEQPGHVELRLGAQPRADRPEDDDEPQEQADHQQHLEHARQVEVLPLLGEERGVLRPFGAVDADRGAAEHAHDHQGDRAEQAVGQQVLPLGFSSGDDRRQEDRGRQERRGRPQQRQLHVPGAGQVEGEDLGEVEAEEALQLDAVVLDGGADGGLDQEQQ